VHYERTIKRKYIIDALILNYLKNLMCNTIITKHHAKAINSKQNYAEGDVLLF